MISFDSEGWIRGSGTVCEPSPFFDDRQADTTVNLVVMHNISLPAGVFGILLLGRKLLGWRSRKALTIFWIAVALQVIAFLAYRFVLDVLK